MPPPPHDTPPAPPHPSAPPRWTAAIDRLSDLAGRATLWLVGVITLASAFNAVTRYVGRTSGTNLSSNAYRKPQPQ